ncbi:hypothetical protein [Aromatoleum buckelii]|uniref:Phasin domain-containing protein n=1 Tax=Aromatoleum buckelii TaxID=200254 RepID=A0ABX1MX71_9RHOO|nr:hypothetical protein [Aromatoleum buckelii]MCK0510160.1 hypothetical protein [Aromatoleum buckelii]
MTKKKAPTILKPSKAIPCAASQDPDETHRNYARAITAPEVAAFRIVSACEKTGLTAQLDTPAMIRMLKDQSEAFNRGDMTHAEAMLSSQATALQTLFTRLAERAMEQSTMAHLEGFMRLALRAQAQCRGTLETLSAIKNPPVIYAKQANVTTGPQQVNNGVAAPSRTGEIENEQNKLLEADDGKWLDPGAAGATSGGDTTLEAVGKLDGAALGNRQGDRGAQRRQGRH